jgi:hypothetical protein
MGWHSIGLTVAEKVPSPSRSAGVGAYATRAIDNIDVPMQGRLESAVREAFLQAASEDRSLTLVRMNSRRFFVPTDDPMNQRQTR